MLGQSFDPSLPDSSPHLMGEGGKEGEGERGGGEFYTPGNEQECQVLGAGPLQWQEQWDYTKTAYTQGMLSQDCSV